MGAFLTLQAALEMRKMGLDAAKAPAAAPAEKWGTGAPRTLPVRDGAAAAGGCAK